MWGWGYGYIKRQKLGYTNFQQKSCHVAIKISRGRGRGTISLVAEGLWLECKLNIPIFSRNRGIWLRSRLSLSEPVAKEDGFLVKV